MALILSSSVASASARLGVCDTGGLDIHMKNLFETPQPKTAASMQPRRDQPLEILLSQILLHKRNWSINLINGCFIDRVFFCTGTRSRSTALEPFPSTFTEKFTDTWPMCLSPNGLQNTTNPQNMSRNRPKFKYATFYKVIMIPKTFTLSAVKQRRLCCPLSPDPNLWTSAANKEWIYSWHGQKFKIQATQMFLFQKFVLAAANLPDMSIIYSKFSSSLHICKTQTVSFQCKTDDTEWETCAEVLLLWVLKRSHDETLHWGW